MTIASELVDLATNLQNAKDAVTAKGGTVGDTGLAGLAAEIMTIPNSGGQDEPSSGGHITGYDATTGVITGDGFGTTQGTVYLLVRETNSYVSQPISSWSDTSITLTNPVDTSVIEGTTSLSVVDSKGLWATKWLITGDIPLAGNGKAYVKDRSDGSIKTISVPSGDTWSWLAMNNNPTSDRAVTIGSDTFSVSDVVGIQIGPDFVLNARFFLGFFVNLNQPLVIPTSLTRFTDYALYYCTNFNQPFVLNNAVTTGVSFMSNCSSFNQPLNLPSTQTSIANYFMIGCSAFNQPFSMPNTITSVGEYFMQGNLNFNSEITFSSTLQSIGTGFLASWTDSFMKFNQPLSFPDTLTSIGTYFLMGNRMFNQPIVLPPDLTLVPSNFITAAAYNSSNPKGGMAFNSKITFPERLTSIGTYFLFGCTNYNQPLEIPSSVSTIGVGFLMFCESYNQPLTIPEGVTTLSEFMVECWSFNKPITLPSTLTTIGAKFLYNCFTFNQPMTFPNGLTAFGNQFMNYCYSFNQKVTIPSTVTTFYNYFLYDIPVSEIETNTTSSPTDNYSLSCVRNYNYRYTHGVTITGTGASSWITNLPNRTANPFRNLIDGTA